MRLCVFCMMLDIFPSGQVPSIQIGAVTEDHASVITSTDREALKDDFSTICQDLRRSICLGAFCKSASRSHWRFLPNARACSLSSTHVHLVASKLNLTRRYFEIARQEALRVISRLVSVHWGCAAPRLVSHSYSLLAYGTVIMTTRRDCARRLQQVE